MKSPSYHTFAQVPSVSLPRSVFDMSSRYKTTFDSGKLVPCMPPIEILPGDSVNLSLQSFARLTTPIVPFMDNLVCDFHFFFVPNRLCFEHWQKLCGEQDNPGDSIDYLTPQVVAPDGGFPVGSIADYFGIPTGVAGLSVNAIPFRAYNLIFNEFYRPELLTSSRPVAVDDGPDTYAGSYDSLAPRYNRLDYFQGATPSPQKGAGVELPLSGTAPVTFGDARISIKNVSTQSTRSGIPQGSQIYFGESISVGESTEKFYGLNSTTQNEASFVLPEGLADLSSATAATINSLRQAFQVQLFLERELLGGSRYTELLRSMFGVISPDARLQRPEYLGGGSVPIVVSTVPQTSSTDSTSPQGNLAAFGLFKGSTPRIKKSFVEHGFVIGLMSVRAPITYQQGLDRMWSRRTRFDYYWPVFAHLGEQAILNKEIYAQGPSVVDSDSNPVDDNVFGYQERYAEYRYGVSHVTGKLRSTAQGTLDYWHLGIKYDSLPVLGNDFAKVNVPLARVLAVQNEPEFVYDSLIHCKMMRVMPLFSQPGRIDHFN